MYINKTLGINMSFIWQEFNIKTFPAETLVFRDGVFCEDLSDYESCHYIKEDNLIIVNKKSELPVHIISVGEISEKTNLNIYIIPEDAKIFMTTKISSKTPANLDIFVKNAGKNSVFRGEIITQNYNSLKIDVHGEHLCENTGIFIKTRVLCHKDSNTELNGFAIINENTKNCDSDISFSVMADESAKIKMSPTQFIKSVPDNASHSASIYQPSDAQILYLRQSGLSGAEVKETLQEAFLEQI